MARATGTGMARGARRAGDLLHLTRWLRVREDGVTSVHTQAPPDLGWGELVVELQIAIPIRLFRPPLLTAHVAIPADAATPDRLSAEIESFVQRALTDATGLEVQIDLRPRPIPLAAPLAPASPPHPADEDTET